MVTMPNLTDHVAIITGAGSGIGASLSRLLGAQGASLTLAARKLDKLNAIAADCGANVMTISADLTLESDRALVVARTLKRWGRIDILVNNAGIGAYGEFLDSTEEQWRNIFEINFFALVFLTREVLPTMLDQGSGLVINMASIGGLVAHSNNVTPYVASKHAVVGFSRALARDLRGTGIRVMAVCPHLTDTEFFSTASGAEKMAPLMDELRPRLDTPEDVAGGIVSQLGSDRMIVFPTDRPAKAFAKLKDL